MVDCGYDDTMKDNAEEMKEKLDQLDQDVAKLREDEKKRAEASGDTPDGPRYYESGDIHPESDDQTITP